MATGLETVLLAGGLTAGGYIVAKETGLLSGLPTDANTTPQAPKTGNVDSVLFAKSTLSSGYAGVQAPLAISQEWLDATNYSQAQIDEALANLKKEFNALGDAAKQKGCDTLNQTVLKDSTKKLSCDESFEEITAVLGAALGTAAGSTLCGPVCGAAAAVAGAYLGKELGEFIEGAWNDVKDWASDQVDNLKDTATDAWNHLENALSEIW